MMLKVDARGDTCPLPVVKAKKAISELKGAGEVEVLVDTIERPEEIDVRRAREAKERVEERMRQHQSKMEYHRNAASLARAMARLKEANKYRH